MQTCPKCGNSLADDVARCDCGEILDALDVSMLRGADRYYALKVIAKVYRVVAWLSVVAGAVRLVLVFTQSTVRTEAEANAMAGDIAVIVLAHGFAFLTCMAITQGIRLVLDLRADVAQILEKSSAK